MHSYQRKSLENKTQAATSPKSDSNTAIQLKDNRPQSVLQQKIKESSGSFNKSPVQRVVSQTNSKKNWKSSELPGKLFDTKKEAEEAEAASKVTKPIGYTDNATFRSTTKPLARAVRDAAFKAHVEATGTAENYQEPDLTIAGSSITGKRGNVGPDRPARDFGPRKKEESIDEGSDYDWNAGHEALAASTMGRWKEGGEKPMIVHHNDDGNVATALRTIGGMPGVPHNIMYSRGRDAVRRNSDRPHLRRSHTPLGERTRDEARGREAIVENETNARAEQARKVEEQAEREKEHQKRLAQLAKDNELAEKNKEKPWTLVGEKKKGKKR